MILNGVRIKAAINPNGWSQGTFAGKADLSTRVLSNAVNGKSVKIETVMKIAKILGLTPEDLIVPEESVIEPPQPGDPKYYMPAMLGKWRVRCRELAGNNKKGELVPECEYHWEAEFVQQGDHLSGIAKCVTPGLEHASFVLQAKVNGRGMLFVDGARGIVDGADHFFRAMAQLETDGRNKSIVGGYVVHEAAYGTIFLGHLWMVPWNE